MPDTTGDETAESTTDGEIDEVAYKLEDWEDEAFVDAEEALRREGVGFRREGLDTIIVSPEDEETVDRVLDAVEAERMRRMEASDGGEDDSLEPAGSGGSNEDGSHEELIYELVDWSPEMRNELSMLLEREVIAHEWEGDDLVVSAAVETEVDALMDQMEQGDELPEAPEDVDDEAEYNLLSDLFVAADRLAGNPNDLALCGDLVDAAGPARDMSVPFGVEELAWQRIQEQTSSLVDAIEAEQGDEVVGERARALSNVLRAYV